MTTPLATPTDIDFDALDIPLPETRRTGRARRRAQLRRERRRRIWRLGSGGAAIVLVLALLAQAFTGSSGDDPGARGTDRAAADAPPALLLVQRDDANRAVSLFVLVPKAGGKGGTLLLMPPGAMAEAPSFGLQPLSQLLELGGPDRLLGTVRNLLGASVPDAHVLDAAGWAALVAPAGSLTVDVPERVEKVDAVGTVEVVYEAGPTKVEPNDVARLLGEKGRGTDLTRLARHQAFWNAWLQRLRTNRDAVPAEPPALKGALSALVAGDVSTRVLPVNAMGADGATELYQVDRSQLARMMRTIFPSAPRAAGARPRIQILNGTGEPGLAQRVTDKLGAGFDVRLTGNAARFDNPETRVVFYDRKQQGTAERVRQALGMGKLVLSRNPLDVVDVTIIVGKDFG
jgi:hypothetical protein